MSLRKSLDANLPMGWLNVKTCDFPTVLVCYTPEDNSQINKKEPVLAAIKQCINQIYFWEIYQCSQ